MSAQLHGVSKIPLIQLPTPLHPLKRLSAELGADLWIKRDDLTGFAMGGNKGRKLEYFMADALAQGCDTVITCGSLQSNFIRQLGAACNATGLKCAAAVMSLPYSSHIDPPEAPAMRTENGNCLLDQILGIDMRVHPDSIWEDLYALGDDLVKEYESKGHKVYWIPIGGSSPLGGYAFYEAGEELKAQGETFDHIIFASSSGSTQTGLGYSFHGLSTNILGIACDPEPELIDDFVKLSAGIDEILGRNQKMSVEDFNFNLDYVGPGYGVPSPAGNAALLKLARTEAIFLDPVYSAKAFSGLLDLLKKGEIGGKILFWHTGGMPSLFALPKEGRELFE